MDMYVPGARGRGQTSWPRIASVCGPDYIVAVQHDIRLAVLKHELRMHTRRLLIYENELVSLESYTYTITSARSVFFGLRSVSASYLEPNSWSCACVRSQHPSQI